MPVSILLVAVAGPLTSLLLAGAPRCNAAATEAVSTRMLVVFAPQILLYGLAVVLYGILQAHRRFIAPALAPVVSSLVVIAAYIAFLPLGGGSQNHLATLPRSAELVLSVGTTAGVAALVLTALGPALRLRLRLRPALHFPDGVARRVRGLAGVGVAALIAQDASLVAIIVLANGHGGQGRWSSTTTAGRCSSCRTRCWPSRSPRARSRSCPPVTGPASTTPPPPPPGR